MKNSERKRKYNRAYYQKNKERILNKRKFNQSNVISFVQPVQTSSQPDLVSRQSASSWFGLDFLEAALLFLLISAITVFLVQESIRFYTAQDGLGGGSAVLKALITEGALLGLAWSRFETRVKKNCQAALSVCLIAFIVATTCHNVFARAIEQQNQFHQKVRINDNHQAKIASLKTEIESKERLFELFLANNRLTTSRNLGQEITTLKRTYRAALDSAPTLAVQEESTSGVLSAVFLAAFRVLILLANILFVKRLRTCLQCMLLSSYRKLGQSYGFFARMTET